MAKPKIAFIDSGWAQNEYRKKTGHYGAIAYYRLVKPMEYLKEWFDIDFYGKEFERFGSGEMAYISLARSYDLIYSKHIDNGAAASALLAMADHYKKPVIVDSDDNYFQIREDNPAYKDYAPLKGGRYFLGAFMSLSQGLTVSTEPLKQIYTHLNKNIDVLPNCNDVNDWKFSRKVHKDRLIRIGYMGSITHNDDLELIWEPMAKILQKYSNVKFEIMGATEPKDISKVLAKIQKHSFKDITNQVWFYGGTQAWYGFPQELMAKGWDIGIAPLVDEPFNHCKSHIKWFDYSMIGIPTIASKVFPYYQPIQGIQTIQHGKTGLLATNSKDWVQCMEEMIVNKTYRLHLADNAYIYIRDNWQYEQHIHKWKDVFNKYL